MNDVDKKTAYPLPKALATVMSYVAEIETGKISSNEMLGKMLMIEGSAGMRAKNLAFLLDDAQKAIPDPDAKLVIDKSIYFFIAQKALKEDFEGSTVGLLNARCALEKGLKLPMSSLRDKNATELSAMIPAQLPRLVQS